MVRGHNIAVKNLNPIELKRSRLPDSKISSIYVSFTSVADRRYNAVHVYEHPNGPYILLESEDKDKRDFSYVEKIVAKETNGTPDGFIYPRGHDICTSIKLREKPTQDSVADFAISYFKYFKDVKIPVAYFHRVSKRDCERSRLPQEKIEFLKY